MLPVLVPSAPVFLDRDGVINRKLPEGQYVRCRDEFQLLAGVPQANAQLNRAGLRMIAVSNQRGVALGLYSEDTVRSIHAALQKLLAEQDTHVDAYYFCPTTNDSATAASRCRGFSNTPLPTSPTSPLTPA